jgi:predicted oxidoreductase
VKTYRIAQTDLEVSCIGYGCMKLGGSWNQTPLTAADKTKAARLVAAACDQGINFFDHADIYALGKSEAVFGQVLQQNATLRHKIIVQSKCGIRFRDDPRPGDPPRYDFSYAHILRSVDGILRRLQSDYLDILLLHRPDPLVEPEEVAKAFGELQRRGKVRYFGVSNHTAAQIALLRRYVEQPLVINQVELNLLHAHLIEEGILANQVQEYYAGAAGTLDYCRLHDILLQAWSPVAKGQVIAPSKQAEARLQNVGALVTKLAGAKATTREAIVLAWLLRHPAHIQPIIGTTDLERLRASCLADQVSLSREEWFTLFIAARGKPLP